LKDVIKPGFGKALKTLQTGILFAARYLYFTKGLSDFPHPDFLLKV
jgi:hypothetical protein